MFINIIAILSAAFLPYSHHTPPAPVAIVAPAPKVVTHDVITAPVVTPDPRPVAVEGPQPVGPAQTLAPLPNRCVVTVTGQTTQDGQVGSGPATFSMPCDQAYAYIPPAGTTDTVTPEPSSDTATTGGTQ